MIDSTMDQMIALLAVIPHRVEALAREAAESGARPAVSAPIGQGEWMASEIVGHLCDSARIWGGRMRRVAYEPHPTIELFDEAAQVRHAAYRYKPLAPLLREFRLLSEGNVAFLRERTPADWERIGQHPERGQITLRQIVEVETAHEQTHVSQLREALGLPI